MNSENDEDEYFEDDKYVMAPEEKQEINDHVKKRTYVRRQPKKPQSEAQKKAFEKARSVLLDNKARKQNTDLRKPQHVYVKEPTQPKKPQRIAQPKSIVQPRRAAPQPVYDDDYEDDEHEEQFMVSDNNKNYIVRPVVRRSVPVQPSRTVVKKRPIKKERIENSIDKHKLDNIVEHQINQIQSHQKVEQPQQSKYVNVYQHKDVIKAQPVNKRNRSLLDDF